MLICAFHSPIERLIHYLARHAFTMKGMPADNGFRDLFAHLLHDIVAICVV
jgi:hypothetical protein